VNSTAQDAEKAYAYDAAIFAAGDPQAAASAGSGFMVFVSADDSIRNHWFRGQTTDESSEFAGFDYARPAIYSPTADPATIARYASSGFVGRIVLAPLTAGAYRQSVIVHEMVHAFMDTTVVGPKSAPPLWVVEGYARWIEIRFRTVSNPVAAVTDSQFKQRSSLPQTTNEMPSATDLRGANASQFYDLAASFFQYLSHNGSDELLPMQVAQDAYTHISDGFSAWATTGAGEAAALQAQWTDWVNSTIAK
jgi:hypothetical protein